MDSQKDAASSTSPSRLPPQGWRGSDLPRAAPVHFAATRKCNSNTWSANNLPLRHQPGYMAQLVAQPQHSRPRFPVCSQHSTNHMPACAPRTHHNHVEAKQGAQHALAVVKGRHQAVVLRRQDGEAGNRVVSQAISPERRGPLCAPCCPVLHTAAECRPPGSPSGRARSAPWSLARGW